MGFKGSAKGLLIAAGLAIALAGCGGEKKQESTAPAAPAAPAAGQQGQLPEGHPSMENQEQADIAKASHASIKTQKEINIPDEVKAKWKEVTLQITNTTQKASANVDIKVGSDVKLDREGFRLKVSAFVPDYAISDNKIETRSNEPKNPAVLVELLEGEKVVAKGWVFKNFPEFNSYTDDRFPVALVAPGEAPQAQKAAAGKK